MADEEGRDDEPRVTVEDPPPADRRRRGRSREAERAAGRRYRFLKTVVMGMVVATMLGAFFTPPDPFTQLLVLVPGTVLAVLVAVWLVYRDGYARVRGSRFHRTDRPRPFVDFLLATLALAVLAGVLRGLDPALAAVDGRVYPAMALSLAYLVVYQGGLDRLGDALGDWLGS